jgi:hypothetical protein
MPPPPAGAMRHVVEARHMKRRIARPALPADVLGEPHVPVGENIEACDVLLRQVHGQRVLVLLAKTRLDHRGQKGPRTEVFGVPARSWQ